MYKLHLILCFLVATLSSRAAIISNLDGEVTVNSGQLSYSFPIALPEGINDLSPSIGVQYSQGGSNSSVGLGFSISGLSSISRCSKTKKIDDIEHGVLLNDSDAYCLDGSRLMYLHGNEYRLRSNNTIKATLSNNTWNVYYPTGVVKEFTSGNTYSGTTLNWNLSTTKDKFNNIITYNYTSSNNVRYIDNIAYNNHTVTFNYTNSPKQYVNYRFGVEHTYDKLLDSIVIHTGNNLIKTYNCLIHTHPFNFLSLNL